MLSRVLHITLALTVALWSPALCICTAAAQPAPGNAPGSTPVPVHPTAESDAHACCMATDQSAPSPAPAQAPCDSSHSRDCHDPNCPHEQPQNVDRQPVVLATLPAPALLLSFQAILTPPADALPAVLAHTATFFHAQPPPDLSCASLLNQHCQLTR